MHFFSICHSLFICAFDTHFFLIWQMHIDHLARHVCASHTVERTCGFVCHCSCDAIQYNAMQQVKIEVHAVEQSAIVESRLVFVPPKSNATLSSISTVDQPMWIPLGGQKTNANTNIFKFKFCLSVCVASAVLHGHGTDRGVKPRKAWTRRSGR